MKIYWHKGSKNLIGKNVKAFRKLNNMTQKALSEKLQLLGYDFSDLTILRIESGTRFVADYEAKAFTEVFGISYEALFEEN